MFHHQCAAGNFLCGHSDVNLINCIEREKNLQSSDRKRKSSQSIYDHFVPSNEIMKEISHVPRVASKLITVEVVGKKKPTALASLESGHNFPTNITEIEREETTLYLLGNAN